MSKISQKLSRRLSLGITLLAVPIFIGTLGILFLQSSRLIRQEATERTSSILNKTTLDVKHFMNTIEVSTDANAWLLEENLTPDSIESISRRILKMNPNILSFSVSTEPDVLPQFGPHFSVYTVRDANTINSYRETEYAYYDKLWYKTALKGEPCWVEPFSEHTEGTINYHEAVASYCRPLHTADGKIAGVISADFSFGLLAKVINELEQHPYPNMYFLLMGKDGRFFIHPDETKLFRKTIFSDTDPNEDTEIIALGHEIANGKQGTRHATIDGQFCHIAFQPVPGTDWSLVLVFPDSEILTDYNLLADNVGQQVVVCQDLAVRLQPAGLHCRPDDPHRPDADPVDDAKGSETDHQPRDEPAGHDQTDHRRQLRRDHPLLQRAQHLRKTAEQFCQDAGGTPREYAENRGCHQTTQTTQQRAEGRHRSGGVGSEGERGFRQKHIPSVAHSAEHHHGLCQRDPGEREGQT